MTPRRTAAAASGTSTRRPVNVSERDGNVCAGKSGRTEEPALDGIARIGHRRIGARLMQEQMVEEQSVARIKYRADYPRVASHLLDHLLSHLVVENGPLGAGGCIVVQSSRDDVHARGHV